MELSGSELYRDHVKKRERKNQKITVTGCQSGRQLLWNYRRILPCWPGIALTQEPWPDLGWLKETNRRAGESSSGTEGPTED